MSLDEIGGTFFSSFQTVVFFRGDAIELKKFNLSMRRFNFTHLGISIKYNCGDVSLCLQAKGTIGRHALKFLKNIICFKNITRDILKHVHGPDGLLRIASNRRVPKSQFKSETIYFIFSKSLVVKKIGETQRDVVKMSLLLLTFKTIHGPQRVFTTQFDRHNSSPMFWLLIFIN